MTCEIEFGSIFNKHQFGRYGTFAQISMNIMIQKLCLKHSNNPKKFAIFMQDFQEFPLYASGEDIDHHHIMKIPHQKFDISTLKPPVTLSRFKPEPTTEPTEEKANPFLKRRTKAFFYGRDDNEEEAKQNPDRHPWVLADDDGQVYYGNREGSQSNYVLFVSSGDGFKVIPASKWYKFTPKVNYRTLTSEEAEEKMKQNSKTSQRWMMKEDSKKSWKQKLLNGESLNSDGAEMPNVKKEKKKKLIDDDGFDYDEMFDDDEEVILGIEDREEEKEASKRLIGKAAEKISFESDDEEDTARKKSSAVQIMEKALKKYDQEADIEEQEFDPYWSEMEDEEAEELKTQQEAKEMERVKALLKKDKQKSKKTGDSLATSAESSRPMSPVAIKRENTSNEEPSRKKAKTETSLPPPPSAVQVVRELEKQRKISGRATSASPPPTELRLSSTPAPSAPKPTTAIQVEEAQGLLTDADMISFMKAAKGQVTVKQVVTAMKGHLAKDARNKARLKSIMKKLLNHDKATGIVTLK